MLISQISKFRQWLKEYYMTTTNDQQIQSDKTTSATKELTAYLEPVFIVAFLSTGAYFIGQLFVVAYLGRLGIHNTFVDLPPSYYLRGIAVPALVFFAAILVSLGYLGTKAPSTVKQAFLANLPILLVVVGGASLPVTLQLFVTPKSVLNVLSVLVAVFALAIYVSFSARKKTFVSSVLRAALGERLLLACAAISILLDFGKS